MSTIISAHNSDKCIGRCDAKCYNAKTPECHCICGGVNHGVGFKIALEDRQYITDADIIEIIPGGPAGRAVRITRTPLQRELFKCQHLKR